MDKMASAVISLAEKHFDNYKIRNGQLIPQYCPFCDGGENKDKETFAVGLNNGAYQCFRGNCKAKGSFERLLEHYNESSDNFDFDSIPVPVVRTSKKVYAKPEPSSLHPITDEIATYFALRRISEDTLNAFKIQSDDNGNIVFPFYRDDVLTFVKYRKPRRHTKADGPKEWQMANTEPILFGMDNASFNQRLFITEGEIDALSLYEAGVHNVVSVPCGCNNTDWVDICWDWLKKFNDIVIFGDSDQPGVEMMANLVQRLGKDRCSVAPVYPQLVVDGKDRGRVCKDANEILYAYGAEALKAIADSCESTPVKGVLKMSEIADLNSDSIARIYTRIPALDRAIGGFASGTLTVISGKRGEGKSTIAGSFMLNAVQQGVPVAAYSGELSAANFRQWIICQAAERQYMTYSTHSITGKMFASPTEEVKRRIVQWLDNKFYLFDNTYVDKGSLVDSLLNRFKLCARRYGCKMFLVDNLMMLTSGNEEEYKLQAKITAALKQFACEFEAVVILVAHPRKTQPNQAFTSDDISGSAAISNLADIVMSIEKPNIRVTKNREFGETAFIVCDFDPSTRRIFQSSIGDRTQYGWDHSGLTKPERSVIGVPEFEIQHGNPDSNPF